MNRSVSQPVLFPLLLLLLASSCRLKEQGQVMLAPTEKTGRVSPDTADIPVTVNSIHLYVALCDNSYQGIVPVPARIGNGQDPANNLYWGWGYGVKTYFSKSAEWKLIRVEQLNYPVLERVVFRHISGRYYLTADAYDGRAMKACITDFLLAASGAKKQTGRTDSINFGMHGNARLLGFIGHDGLMDFTLEQSFPAQDKIQRDCMVLACYSRHYFSPYLKQAGANPLLWTSNLFGPEAYSVHEAVSSYIKGETATQVRDRAAVIYARYTHCSVNAAKKLLVTGW